MKLPQQILRFFQLPSPVNPKKTVIEYLAQLVTINRGEMEVTKFGDIETTTDNVFGRYGITVMEAFHLTQLTNFLKGILFGCGSPELEEAIKDYIRSYVRKESTGSSLFVPTGEDIRRYGK